MNRVLLGFLCAVMTAGALEAAVVPPAKDHVKVMIHKRSTRDAQGTVKTVAIDTSAFPRLSATVIDDRQGYLVADLPISALEELRRVVLRAGAIAVEERPDFETLEFATMPIDAREPQPIYPAPYSRQLPLSLGARDEFIIQFASVPRDEWLADLQAAGVTILEYVPRNGYTVLGSASALANVAQRLPVQLLRLHQPVHKVQPSLRAATSEYSDATIVVHRGAEGDVAREFLNTITLSTVRPPEDILDRSYLRLSILTDSLPQVAALPGVIRVESLPTGAPSGEREVDIAAGLAAIDYAGRLVPTGQGAYKQWLSQVGINPETLSPTGMLDTGWHTGPSSIHNDLRTNAGASTITSINYTLDGDTASNPNVDCSGHGTMVAGILGGNPDGPYGSLTRDSGGSGYYMGQGMLPGAAVISGRVYNYSGNTNNYFQPIYWTTIYPDLRARGVRVTNNSWNFPGGDYNSDTSIIDGRVRHVGADTASGPMTIIVSAGNKDEGDGSAYVTAPANAKNVITVGASQGFNDNTYTDVWASGSYPTAGGSASDGKLMWAGSRTGPTYPWYSDGRIKPDIVAPGTGIESARTEYGGPCYRTPAPNVGSTIDASPTNSRHIWSRGTSFSAPLAAGTANLLRAFHGDLSPAMTKAMLIGLASPLSPSDHSPQSDSGWGRLNLARAFRTTGFVKVDQSVVLTNGGPIYSTGSLSVIEPYRPVRIVLTWTDAVDVPAGGPQLKNDLDLVVWSTDPNRYYFWSIGNSFIQGYSRTFGLGQNPDPWMWDRVNNVEVVVPSVDLGSSFRIEVRPTSVVANALTSGYPAQQDFALFIDNVQ
jgi:Subtilase family